MRILHLRDLCLLFVSKTLLYLLYSVMSLSRSSVEILLLSCLKRGENRDSRSTMPWLSLNTDLKKWIHRDVHLANIFQLANDAHSTLISVPHNDTIWWHSSYLIVNVFHTAMLEWLQVCSIALSGTLYSPYRPRERHAVFPQLATELLVGFQHLLNSLEKKILKL